MTASDQTIREMLADGKSQRATAEALHVSRYRVGRIATAAGIIDPTETRALDPSVVGAALAGGRESTDSATRAGYGTLPILIQDTDTREGAASWLDETQIRTMSPAKLLELSVDSSPELSRALWDWLRYGLPGHEINVYSPGGSQVVSQRGQDIVDNLRARIRWRHGAEEVVYGRLLTGMALRGAACAELVLDDDARTALEIATPDPASIQFRQHNTPPLGTWWEKGQTQNGQWVSLETPRFQYIALDPLPGKPYGRSPFTAAIFPCLFLLGFFQDLRRVVANQGYPRLDIEVQLDAIYALLTGGDEDREGDIEPAVALAMVRQVTDMTGDVIRNLKPSDTFIHSSLVKVNPPIGAMGQGALGSVAGIIEALERMAVKALKTVPLLQGIHSNAAEANVNRQWEAYAKSVKDVHHRIENLLGSIYEVACLAEGIIVEVEVRFAELRVAEEYRDQQTLQLRIQNTLQLMDAGFLTPEEAAIEALGFISDAVAESYDDPAGSAKGDAPEAAPVADDENPDPGADRGTARRGRGGPRMRVVTAPGAAASRWVRVPDGRREIDTGGLLPTVPDDVSVTTLDELSASAQFDQWFPDEAGMLAATIVEE